MRITPADERLVREILTQKIRDLAGTKDIDLGNAFTESEPGIDGVWFPIWLKVEYSEIEGARGGGK